MTCDDHIGVFAILQARNFDAIVVVQDIHQAHVLGVPNTNGVVLAGRHNPLRVLGRLF